MFSVCVFDDELLQARFRLSRRAGRRGVQEAAAVVSPFAAAVVGLCGCRILVAQGSRHRLRVQTSGKIFPGQSNWRAGRKSERLALQARDGACSFGLMSASRLFPIRQERPTSY